MQPGRILAFCNASMFLRSNTRIKDGKQHRYYTVVESRRLQSGKVVQRQVLYLGEINDSQQAAWRKTLEVFDEAAAAIHTAESVSGGPAGSRRRDRQRAGEAQRDEAGAGAAVWQLLVGMRAVAAIATGSVLVGETAARGGKSVAWPQVLELLVVNRLIDPGSEFRVAPAVVRSERDGRVAGAGFCGGGKGPAVPLSGSGAGT